MPKIVRKIQQDTPERRALREKAYQIWKNEACQNCAETARILRKQDYPVKAGSVLLWEKRFDWVVRADREAIVERQLSEDNIKGAVLTMTTEILNMVKEQLKLDPKDSQLLFGFIRAAETILTRISDQKNKEGKTDELSEICADIKGLPISERLDIVIDKYFPAMLESSDIRYGNIVMNALKLKSKIAPKETPANDDPEAKDKLIDTVKEILGA